MAKIFVNVDGVDIEAKGEVLQEILDFQAKCKAEEDALKAKAEAKAEAKAAAQAKLATLGLTVEDLTALGL